MRKLKNKFVLVIAFILAAINIFSVYAEAVTFTPDFTVNSDSAILLNLDTSNIVYEKNPDKQQIPAQLVNIMTAIICLENCSDLKTTITADNELYADIYNYGYPNDIRYGDIYNGDVLTVEDLLYSLMLSSASESANILAYYFGGNSIKKFVEMMNAKAKEIGAVNTNFANPHGLYAQEQVSTARDMMLITQYALKNPEFEKIATTQSYTPSIPNTENGHGSDWYWTHSNVMMMESSDYYYPGVKGIKTGNLEKGGRSLITMASVDGVNYLLVLMNAPLKDLQGNDVFYHLVDAKNIFDWAFEHIKYKVILSDSEEIREIPIKFGKGDNDFVLLKPANEFASFWDDNISVDSVQKQIKTDADKIFAPVEKGEKLGTVDLMISGETIGSVDLVSAGSVERSSYKYNLEAARKFKNSDWFRTGVILSTIFSVIYIIICIISYHSANRKRPVKGVYASKNRGRSIHGSKKMRFK